MSRASERVTRCNRIDPWGDLHADPARGLFTGNRGPLVDDERRIVRHHASSTLWITCMLRFRDWRHPLDQLAIDVILLVFRCHVGWTTHQHEL